MKKYILQILFFAVFAIAMTACKNDKKAAKAVETPPTEQQVQAVGEVKYPSLPVERIEKLWENCDYIDYVYYELAMSMSIDNPEGIRSFLRHVSAEPAVINDNCKSIGRIFYQIDGENELDAEFIFRPEQGCTYLVFNGSDGKPAYANKLTKEAVAYYNKVFGSVEIVPRE